MRIATNKNTLPIVRVLIIIGIIGTVLFCGFLLGVMVLDSMENRFLAAYALFWTVLSLSVLTVAVALPEQKL